MKWLVVLAIALYLCFRLSVLYRPNSWPAKFAKRRFVLRADTAAMSRRELALSALTFGGFGAVLLLLFVVLRYGGARWALLTARGPSVLAMACLFIGGLAVIGGLYLAAAAIIARDGGRSP